MITTRFAPSPTGPFHIGNARTALFNFLYARSNKGQFILRIEDTDRQRSQKPFEDEIVESLKWLGLRWDGPVIRQSERLATYRRYLDDLTTEGLAYEQGGAFYFRASSFRQELKHLEFHDLIRGKIRTPTKVIDDFVIVKSDGTPLFLFTNIIDDVALGVSHVIRGEDHISNTPRQLMIARSLDLKPPDYGHVPIILAPDRSKLSKRHGAVSIGDYRAQGYLPEAIINFLALLGWHPSEKLKTPAFANLRFADRFGKARASTEEYFTLGELIKEFSLERVQKAGAVFDIEKLDSLNRHYIRQLTPDQLVVRVNHFSAHGQEDPGYLEKVASLIGNRLTRLVEFDSEVLYFFQEPSYDPKLLIFKKSTQAKTIEGLGSVISKLEISELEDWQSSGKLQQLLAAVVAGSGLMNGDVFWPVRVALSGTEASPGPSELLWAMGKERALARLQKGLGKLSRADLPVT